MFFQFSCGNKREEIAAHQVAGLLRVWLQGVHWPAEASRCCICLALIGLRYLAAYCQPKLGAAWSERAATGCSSVISSNPTGATAEQGTDVCVGVW